MPLTETDVIRIRQFLQKLKSGLVEGMDVYTTYHDSNLAATPSDPTGDGTTGGWHRLATEASNWMSVKTALKDTSGTWGTPIRVFGLQGTETAGVGTSDDVPKLVQIKFIGDGGSKVGWTAGTVEYGGSSYAIDVKAVGDASTDQFIYWDDADGQTSFKTTATLATAIGANHHYVCRNDSGVATPAWIQRIILGGVIQAKTLNAAIAIIAKSVTAAELSDSLNADIADRVKTFYQDAVPTAENAGDIWFDTNDGLKMHRATAEGDDQVTAGEWEHVDLTIIDGGNITVATILAASIFSYNLTAANATIEELFVKTAHIENLNVTTGKIDDDATHITESAYTAGQVTVTGTESTVQSESIESQGNVVEALGSIDAEADAGDVWLTVYLYEGSTIIDFKAEAVASGFTKAVTVGASRVTGSGSQNFYLKAKRTSGAANFKAGSLSLQLKESLGK